ncbi:MAG: hypothetical protein Q9211_006791 [Gyalolechia sp. 1 TL-2023]
MPRQWLEAMDWLNFLTPEFLESVPRPSGYIKALAPLRSSDRRRIADQIIAEHGIEIPTQGPEEGPESGNGTSTTGVGAIRNSLLPENSLSARFTTTAGKDLKQVSGTVYMGAHPGEEQRILWIKFEDRFLPTGWLLVQAGKLC